MPIHIALLEKEKQDQDGLRSGVYLSSFCVGLDNILEPYRLAILTIEQEVSQPPIFNVIHTAILYEYIIIFKLYPTLWGCMLSFASYVNFFINQVIRQQVLKDSHLPVSYLQHQLEEVAS